MSTRQSHDRRDRFIHIPAVPSSWFHVPRSCSAFRFWVLGSGFHVPGLSFRNVEPRTLNKEPEPRTRTRNSERGTRNCSSNSLRSLREQDLRHAGGELAPGGGFSIELRATFASQPVKLRA